MSAERGAVRAVLWKTLGLNLAVSAAKVVAGQLTGSAAMTADGLHSLGDGANNVVGLVVLAVADAPPDEGHPYGHRKFETAASAAVGLVLLAVAFQTVSGALARVRDPHLPAIGPLSFLVMGGTLAVNLFVAWYEAREGRRLGSSYLLADAAHTSSDVYVTLGVFLSFAGARAGLAWVDPVVAALIGGFIAFVGAQVLIGSFHALTDRAVLPASALAGVVRGVPGVVSCGEVRTRGSEREVYVDLVAYVDGGVTLRAAHEVADGVEAALKAAHPEIVDVVVHVEPA